MLRLLRSPLLWLGLFGLGFLIWAWANSVTTSTTLIAGRGKIFVDLRSGEGSIRVIACTDSPILYTTGLSYETQTIRTPWDFFSPPALGLSRHALGWWEIEAGYWLIIFLYLTFWILALGWLAKKRTAATTPNVPRGTP